jgi:hypothetical protein
MPDEAVRKRAFLVGDVYLSKLSGTRSFHFYSTPIPSRTGYDANGKKTITGTSTMLLSRFNKQSGTYVTITPEDYLADYAADGSKKLIGNGIKYNEDFYNRINDYSQPIALRTGAAPSFESDSLTEIQLDPNDSTSTL